MNKCPKHSVFLMLGGQLLIQNIKRRIYLLKKYINNRFYQIPSFIYKKTSIFVLCFS